jgi:hypothetical protein
MFKTLTSGFSRFVLAWIVPSIATLAVFVVFLYPQLAGSRLFVPLERVVSTGKIQAAATFAFGALLLSLLFSLGSLPLYRLLEGYTLPRSVRRSWTRKQARRRLRLQRTYDHLSRNRVAERGQIKEKLDLYPLERREVLPTRLGNGFKAIETYGARRYNLDSQVFHYELSGVVSDRVERDSEDARSQVDFFLGFVGQLSLLTAVAGATALLASSASALLVGLVSALLARLAYRAAVTNLTDLRFATQAMVNLGRPSLAAGLGYRLPQTLDRERRLWRSWTDFVERGDGAGLVEMDDERLSAADSDEPAG